MGEYGGFLFVIDEERRASRVRVVIEREGIFTDAISVDDLNAKRAEIFLISLAGGAIDYAALAHRGRAVATGKRLVRFTNFVGFTPPLRLEEIEGRLGPGLRSHFVRASSGIGSRVTPKTWQGVMEVIRLLRPDGTEGLDRLEKLREMGPEFFSRPGVEVLAEEKDAVNFALRASGFDKEEVTAWSPPDDEEKMLPPYVQGLAGVKLIEDQLIAHDASVFGGWENLGPAHVASAVFKRGSERLSVMNVNRHPVEQTLGVDLFYYHYRYESYVTVQYKRMEKGAAGDVFWLNDETYEKELRRMRRYEAALRKARSRLPFELRDFRLHPGTAYFKLCPAGPLDPSSTDMIKGMYIPLEYWEALLRSPNVVGERGGRRMTFESVERYFNNTLFIELVQAGWVGSNPGRTEVLTELIKASLEGNSVLLAALLPDEEP